MQLLQTELLTDSLSNTETFYSYVLGFSVLDKSENHVSFKAGSSILRFNLAEGSRAYYHFAFNIPCNQLEKAFKWIKDKAELIPVTNDNYYADFSNWHARSFYFYDNNGSILEFIARYDLKDEVHTEHFNVNQISCISEIGIVCRDLDKECTNLMETYSFTYFDMQPPLENFKVLGDNNGLLILSSHGRNWYPTETIAENFETKVKVKEGEEVIELVFH